MRPAIASISYMNKVQKAPVIYITALYWIFFKFLREWNKGALLKYDRENL